MVYRVLKEAESRSEAVGLYATGEPFLNKDLKILLNMQKKSIILMYL